MQRAAPPQVAAPPKIKFINEAEYAKCANDEEKKEFLGEILYERMTGEGISE